jgi:hypothetical protein
MFGQNLIFVRATLLLIPMLTNKNKTLTKAEKRNLEITCLHQQKMKLLKTILL